VGAAMHSVLPVILKRFAQKYPGVQLRLYELDNTQQVEALKKGIIDIGFLRSRMNDETISVNSVSEEAFVLVTPKHLKIQSLRSVELKRLQSLPFIGFPMTCAPDMVKSIYNLMEKLNLHPGHIHESPQINSIVRLVEAGMGYSVLPSAVGGAYKGEINVYDLSRFPERAFLLAGFHHQRRQALVDNMLNILRAKK
jgi:DNA-binding transcriptional LysR family regulator